MCCGFKKKTDRKPQKVGPRVPEKETHTRACWVSMLPSVCLVQGGIGMHSPEKDRCALATWPGLPKTKPPLFVTAIANKKGTNANKCPKYDTHSRDWTGCDSIVLRCLQRAPNCLVVTPREATNATLAPSSAAGTVQWHTLRETIRRDSVPEGSGSSC